MQRLFSTFANGLPGIGLLFQRLVTGGVLIQSAFVHLRAPTDSVTILPQSIGLFAGILLMAGFWTPIAGVLIAVAELWAFVLAPGEPCIALLLATSGASLALIGPGAWSLDAIMFGRKQISVPLRRSGAE